MYRIKNLVNEKTLKMIYFSLIYPHLLYGVPIWGNADNTHLNSLLILQKKAVRIISNKDKNIHKLYKLPGNPDTYWLMDTFVKEPSSPIFNDLNILKIHDIFNIATLNFVYESIKQINPRQFHEYYHYPTNDRNTAANRKHNLDTPQMRTVTYGIKSIKYTGCILWNNLPDKIRTSPSKKSFTKLTKNHFLSMSA